MEETPVPAQMQSKVEGGSEEVFGSMCSSVLSSYHLLSKALEELYEFKDELLNYSLPHKLLMRMTLLVSQIMRCQSDLCIPMNEMVRLLRLYSSSWEDKSKVLKQIHDQQASKQRQLTIALKKVEILSSESERLQKERASNNWAMLFSKVLVSKSHGRRWKFRMEEFKRNAEQGFSKFNPFGLPPGGAARRRSSHWESSSSESEMKSVRFTSDTDLDKASSATLGGRGSSSRSKSSTGSTGSVTVIVPPKPVMFNKAVSTSDPSFECFLLLRLYHPTSIIPDKDAMCSLRFCGDLLTSKPFKLQATGSAVQYHDFHLELTESDARTIRIPDLLGAGTDHSTPLLPSSVPSSTGSISISVHPDLLSNPALATASIKLSDLRLEGPPTVLVPPMDRGVPFDVGWEYIRAILKEEDAVTYPCSGAVAGEIKVLSHLVKVQSHLKLHAGTETNSLDECVMSMGFRKVMEQRSRATSARKAAVSDMGVVTSLVWRGGRDSVNGSQLLATPPSPEDEDGRPRPSQEQIAEIMVCHAQELQELQDQYEQKLSELSKAFNQLKLDKKKQEEDFAAQEMESVARLTSKSGSATSYRARARASHSRRQQSLMPGLPEWGRDLPDNFFERMEVFAREAMRKQAALSERIRREIADKCEQCLALHHRLSLTGQTAEETGMADVCLPALYMPTPLRHTYTPRAHQYFHPSGTSSHRVTQPPSIFQLPALTLPQTLVVAGGRADSGSLLQPDPTRPPCRTGKQLPSTSSSLTSSSLDPPTQLQGEALETPLSSHPLPPVHVITTKQ